jgi:hypothetical protein
MMKSHIAKLTSAALSVVVVLALVSAPAASAAPVAPTCESTELVMAPSAASAGALSLVVDGKTYEVTGKLRSDSNGNGYLCLRLHGNGHIKVTDDKIAG